MNTRQIDEIKKLDLDELTKQVADVNSPLTEGEAEGWTLICVAILQDRLDKVKEFIDAGADCSLAMQGGCEGGCTPIYIAAKYGCLDIARFLIVKKNVDFTSPLQDGDTKGRTPIHAAAQKGHVDVVRFLVLEMNVDCSAALQDGDAKGCTPIFVAATNGHENVVRFLLKQGADFILALQDGEFTGYTSLFFAASNNHILVVRTMLMYWIKSQLQLDFIPLEKNFNCMLEGQQCFQSNAEESDRVKWELEFILSALQASLKEMYFLDYAFSSSAATPESWLSDDCLALIAYQDFLQSVNCSYEFFSSLIYTHGNLLISGMMKTREMCEEMKERIHDDNHNRVVEVEDVAVREEDAAEQAASGMLQAELGFFSSSLNDRCDVIPRSSWRGGTQRF